MVTSIRATVTALAAAFVCAVMSTAAGAQTDSSARAPHTETGMQTARGTFEVKLTPLPTQATDEHAEGGALGRMSIDKVYSGDLTGPARGEMLTALTATEGSAGYVAIERVSGTLAGRSGTFVLQHTGTMNRGAQQLSITVVPDSGTGELTGLSGTMRIMIEGGKHSYEFDYTLAGAAR